MSTIQEQTCKWCDELNDIPNIRFCPHCGRPTGRISEDSPILVYSSNSPEVDNGGLDKVELQEGESFSIIFKHKSGDSVKIKYNISNAENIKVKDSDKIEGEIDLDKDIGQTHLDLCLKDYTKEVKGTIKFKYNNPNRNPDETWKRKDIWTKEISYNLTGKILIASKECILESEFLFFSKKIKQQNIRIYNPSDKEKKYTLEAPIGYSITQHSNFPIKGYNSEIFSISINKDKKIIENNVTSWKFENNEVKLFELPTQTITNIQKSKLQIIFYLGTKKMAIRAYWKGFSPLEKKTGDIEKIGGDYFSPAMILDVTTGKGKYFFEEAEKFEVKDKQFKKITNLKTYLRDFDNKYTNDNKDWTNEYLLSILFSEISKRIKRWYSELFKSKGKEAPTNFNECFQKPEYVFSYPILDKEEKTNEYKDILKRTFINSFGEKIEESQIKFISEPEAIFNYIKSEKQDIISNLNNGELFAIVDAGAGTTDFSIGKIDKTNENISLKDIKSITLDLNENQKKDYYYLQQDEKHIGGNVIDRILSNVLETKAESILESKNGDEIKNIWQKLKLSKKTNNFKVKFYNAIKEKKKLPEKFQERLREADIEVDYDSYGDNIIKPLLQTSMSKINEKFISRYGIDIKNIDKIIMVGGSNICEYMREYTLSNLPIDDLTIAEDINKKLTDEDRLNAVIEGSIFEIDTPTKKSFATFTIKDENETIEKEIIKEGAVIAKKYIPISFPLDEDTVILNLYAKSELWHNETKKIASARFNATNVTSSDYGDSVYFEISILEEHCKWHIKCDISGGGYNAVGWDINI